MEEIAQALKTLADRIRSPILLSFAVSWCLWNYRFLVILFSDASISTTFRLVDTHFSGERMFYQGFLFPALSSAAYLFGFPFLNREVERFLRTRQKLLVEDRHAIDGSVCLSIEESRRLRQMEETLQAKYEQRLVQAHSQINQLNAAIADLQEQRTNAKDELTLDEQRTLTALRKRAGEADLEDLSIDTLLDDTVYLKYVLDQLNAKGLITFANNNYVLLSPKGRAAVVALS